MDFDRLRAFVWSLEEGGISAAAKRLCRTQPAVSRMLQTLEEQVGAQLIDRRARPLRPTAAGLRILQHAREILQAADRMTATDFRGAARQSLKLAVSRSLLWHLRDPRFVTPSTPLRETDFIVRSGWSPRLYARFARREFDGAILLLPAAWQPDVPCRAAIIRPERLVLIAPRAHHAPARMAVTAKELAESAWLLNPDGCGFRHALSTALAKSGHELRVQFEVDSAPFEHLSMVAAGIGCSIVPASALAPATRLVDRVQELCLDDFDAALNVWALWNEHYQPIAGTEEALEGIFSMSAELSGAEEATQAAPRPAIASSL